ncbi:hypothetical protein [Marilutibacter chinensis]|uniref:Uncharacterized protein n=1 Tax=Marilutibacter chinensis TaxID=2912247 RepID=A0ABS9HZU4_9GAMM|nr:hypothetical protein [Lysobacter chinensis]MCF7223875.1 hypothetical protein [Lysobacter chinensis]
MSALLYRRILSKKVADIPRGINQPPHAVVTRQYTRETSSSQSTRVAARCFKESQNNSPDIGDAR